MSDSAENVFSQTKDVSPASAHDAILLAARKNDVVLLNETFAKSISEIKPESIIEAARLAAYYGSLEIIQKIHPMLTLAGYNIVSLFNMAVASDNLELIKYVVNNGGVMSTVNPELLKHAMPNIIVTFGHNQGLATYAVHKGDNPELFEGVANNGGVVTSDMLFSVSSKGKDELIEFCLSHTSAEVTLSSKILAMSFLKDGVARIDSLLSATPLSDEDAANIFLDLAENSRLDAVKALTLKFSFSPMTILDALKSSISYPEVFIYLLGIGVPNGEDMVSVINIAVRMEATIIYQIVFNFVSKRIPASLNLVTTQAFNTAVEHDMVDTVNILLDHDSFYNSIGFDTLYYFMKESQNSDIKETIGEYLGIEMENIHEDFDINLDLEGLQKTVNSLQQRTAALLQTE